MTKISLLQNVQCAGLHSPPPQVCINIFIRSTRRLRRPLASTLFVKITLFVWIAFLPFLPHQDGDVAVFNNQTRDAGYVP